MLENIFNAYITMYFAIAFERMPILLSLGGIDACPTVESTLNSISRAPFSATPILKRNNRAIVQLTGTVDKTLGTRLTGKFWLFFHITHTNIPFLDPSPKFAIKS